MTYGWTDIKKYRDLTVLLIKFGRNNDAGPPGYGRPVKAKW